MLIADFEQLATTYKKAKAIGLKLKRICCKHMYKNNFFIKLLGHIHCLVFHLSTIHCDSTTFVCLQITVDTYKGLFISYTHTDHILELLKWGKIKNRTRSLCLEQLYLVTTGFIPFLLSLVCLARQKLE